MHQNIKKTKLTELKPAETKNKNLTSKLKTPGESGTKEGEREATQLNKQKHLWTHIC